MVRAETTLLGIANSAKMYSPSEKIEIIKDADDNMLIELAVECNADYLITGNTNDFQISYYKNTKIVSPKEYWEIYR